MEKVSPLRALKMFFEPPRLTMDEVKALSKEERHELAALAAAELGVEIVA